MVLVIFLFLMSVKVSWAKMEGFIVNGDHADIRDFPHSAFLVVDCLRKGGNWSQWICGSSLVNQRMLVTAAHCLYMCLPGSKTTFNLGDTNREKGLRVTGSGFVIHEKYYSLTNDNDIALVKLRKPVAFTNSIKRVALMKNPPYGEPAALAGWGLIDEFNPTSALLLRKVDQRVWKRQACSRVVGYMPKGTICASSQSKDMFASQGDSGSALVVRGYIQIGLVSFKTPSKGVNVIVYTDVGYFYDWIVHNVYQLHCYQRPG